MAEKPTTSSDRDRFAIGLPDGKDWGDLTDDEIDELAVAMANRFRENLPDNQSTP